MGKKFSATHDSWTVLFGGRGREKNLFSMLKHGYVITQVVFPEKYANTNKAFLSRCRDIGLEFIVAKKKDLQDLLRGGEHLLSIGFPYIIPREVLDRYHLCLNIHPTLLPKYKGPSTGAYVIMNREKESGSTIHVMTDKLDDGPILGQHRVDLDEFDTVRSLQEKVYEIEPKLLISTLDALILGKEPLEINADNSCDYLELRRPSDSRIDPNQQLIKLVNQIRASDPETFPAFFEYEGEILNIKLWREVKHKNKHPKSL